MRSPSRIATAVLIAAAAFGVNGLASADSGTATYNGCENVATGIIRLLPSNLPAPYNTTCNTTTKSPLLLEKPITWNQTGPTGPAGARDRQERWDRRSDRTSRSDGASRADRTDRSYRSAGTSRASGATRCRRANRRTGTSGS